MVEFVTGEGEYIDLSLTQDPDVVREMARLKQMVESKLGASGQTLQALKLGPDGDWQLVVRNKL